MRGFGNDRGPDGEPRHRRVLEDPHPPFEQYATEPPREPGRLHAGPARRVHAATEQRRAASCLDLFGRERLVDLGDTQSRGDLGEVLRTCLLHRGGRDPDVAGPREPRVDLVLVAPPPDGCDALVGCACDPQAEVRAVEADELLELVPEAVHEPAVAAARSATADVLLQEHDVQAGIAFLQEPGAPHPRVAAAEDHDVGGRVAHERRGGLSGEAGLHEGFLEPP